LTIQKSPPIIQSNELDFVFSYFVQIAGGIVVNYLMYRFNRGLFVIISIVWLMIWQTGVVEAKPDNAIYPKTNECFLHKARRIGSLTPLDVSVNVLNYSVGRFQVATRYYRPGRDEKFLIMHYSIKNAGTADIHVNAVSIDWQAIDSNGTSHEANWVCGERTTQTLDQDLHTGQVVDCYTCFTIPAKSTASILTMAAHGETSDAWYDLEGDNNGKPKVGPIPSPYADPADSSGATPLMVVPGVMNTVYMVGDYDIKVVSLMKTTQKISDWELQNDQEYAIVSVSMTSFAEGAYDVSGNNLLLKDSTGQTYERSGIIDTYSQGPVEIKPQPGETVKCRIVYRLPKGTNLKSFLMNEDTGRTIDVSFTPNSSSTGTTGTTTTGTTGTTTTSTTTTDTSKQSTSTQNFGVTLGQGASIGFPITQPGKVKIDISWTGVPLAISLFDPNGKPVVGPNNQSSPSASIDYDITAADVNKGVFWGVSLRDIRPVDPKQRPILEMPDINTIRIKWENVASGSITITAPAADPDKVKTASDTSTASIKSLAESKRIDLLKTVAARFAQEKANTQQAESQRLTALENSLRARFKGPAITTINTPAELAVPTGSKTGSSTGKTISSGSTSDNKVTGPHTDVTQQTRVTGNGYPTLTKVSPNYGYYNDDVVLSCKNISSKIKNDQVWFNINSGKKTQVKIISATKTKDGVDLHVKVPTTATGLVVTDCTVYVMATDRNPSVKTLELDFDYRQNIKPYITSIEHDIVTPGYPAAIHGKNLLPGSRVHFVYANGAEYESCGVFQNTELLVSTPDTCSLTATTPVKVFVVKTYKSDSGSSDATSTTSNEVTCSAPPNTTTIDSFDRYSACGNETLLITGSGFYNPSVFFTSDPGQTKKTKWAAYLNTTWKVLSWNENSILVQLPDVQGITDSVVGQLGVYDEWQSKKTAASVRFTINVTYVVKPIMDYCKQANFATDTVYDAWGCRPVPDKGSWVWGTHSAGLLTGFTRDDVFFAPNSLENGWVVDHGDVWNDDADNHAGASLYNDPFISPLSNTPVIVVHSWGDAPYNGSTFHACIYIRGPKGVPYSVFEGK